MLHSLAPSFFNLLVALPQDAYSLYVYWAFAPERLEVLRSFLQKLRGEQQLVLRLCCTASLAAEIAVPLEETGCFYFYLPEPLASYRLEIGIKSPEGKFFSLSHTPLTGFAPSSEHALPSQPTDQTFPPGYFPLEMFKWS